MTHEEAIDLGRALVKQGFSVAISLGVPRRGFGNAERSEGEPHASVTIQAISLDAVELEKIRETATEHGCRLHLFQGGALTLMKA